MKAEGYRWQATGCKVQGRNKESATRTCNMQQETSKLNKTNSRQSS
jgi:hypothetical protein